MESGIYCIINILNNKCYVGSSRNIKNRIKDHKKRLRSKRHCNPHLQNAWEKAGESFFIFVTLEPCKEEDLLEREKYWIGFKKSDLPEFGYNICVPGTYSPKKHVYVNKELYCINNKTGEKVEYSSPIIFSDSTGYSYKRVLEILSNWANGKEKKKSLFGYTIVYKKDYIEGKDYTYRGYDNTKREQAANKRRGGIPRPIKKVREVVPIICENVVTGEQTEFLSTVEAIKTLNLLKHKVYICLKYPFKQRSHRGYYFKRKDTGVSS